MDKLSWSGGTTALTRGNSHAWCAASLGGRWATLERTERWGHGGEIIAHNCHLIGIQSVRDVGEVQPGEIDERKGWRGNT